MPKEILELDLDLTELFGPLEACWEVRETSAGKQYFVNHSLRSTQFTDPRLVANVDRIKQIVSGRTPNAEKNNNVTAMNSSNSPSNGPATNANSSTTSNGTANPPTNVKAQPVQQPPPPPPPNNKNSINKLPLNHRDLDFNIQTTTVQRKNLVQKMSTLRKELSALQLQSGHCKLEVSRKDIFEESFIAVRKMKPKDLRKRLMIKFKGEEGLGRCIANL